MGIGAGNVAKKEGMRWPMCLDRNRILNFVQSERQTLGTCLEAR